jgi:molecular chaperone DnaJ
VGQDPHSLDDIFTQIGELFGASFGHLSQHLGLTLELTDAEAAAGGEREVTVQRSVPCSTCDGRGTANPKSTPTPCAKCSGKGQLQHAQGFFMVATACGECKGTGVIIKNPCRHCGGLRTITTPAKVTVDVPAGIEHGGIVKVVGQGSKGLDGTVGDLNVFVLVGGRPDPRDVAFAGAPVQAELPRATLRTKEQRRPWGVFAIAAFFVLLALILVAR